MAIDDIEPAVGFLAEQGVPVLAAPIGQPLGERMALVADPDGDKVMRYDRPAP